MIRQEAEKHWTGYSLKIRRLFGDNRELNFGAIERNWKLSFGPNRFEPKCSASVLVKENDHFEGKSQIKLSFGILTSAAVARHTVSHYALRLELFVQKFISDKSKKLKA
jgi:hypothetical protein